MNLTKEIYIFSICFDITKMDGTVSQRCVSKFKIEVRICIPAIK